MAADAIRRARMAENNPTRHDDLPALRTAARDTAALEKRDKRRMECARSIYEALLTASWHTTHAYVHNHL